MKDFKNGRGSFDEQTTVVDFVLTIKWFAVALLDTFITSQPTVTCDRFDKKNIQMLPLSNMISQNNIIYVRRVCNDKLSF